MTYDQIPDSLYRASNVFRENSEAACDFYESNIPGIGVCFYSPWEDKYFIQIDSIFFTLVFSSEDNGIMLFNPGL